MAVSDRTSTFLRVGMGDKDAANELITFVNNVTNLASTTLTPTAAELNAIHSSGITASGFANLIANANFSLAGGTSVDVSTVAASTTTVSIAIPSTLVQAATGNTVEAEAFGIFANTATAKNLNVYFGSTGTVAGDTAIFTSVGKTAAYSGSHWAEYVTIMFNGQTGARCNVVADYGQGAITTGVTQAEEAFTAVTAVTAGTTQYITFALSGTTSDVTLKMAKAIYKP